MAKNDRRPLLRFTESERVVVSIEPDETGAYIGYLKSAFVPVMPRTEKERDRNFNQYYKEALENLENLSKEFKQQKAVSQQNLGPVILKK